MNSKLTNKILSLLFYTGVICEQVQQSQLENTMPNVTPINDILPLERSPLMCCQKKESDSRFCAIKALLLEHMLAKTNIHARHNLAIRRKLLDVKATHPGGRDETDL